MEATRKYVSVGKLGKSRGLGGEIYVTPSTDFPERFLDLKEVYLAERDDWKQMRIESSRLVGGRPVLKFDSVNCREDAIKLTNRELAVGADQLVELPQDSYYTFDLVGCEVFEAMSGKQIGKLIDVQRYPASDVYVIETDGGREVLVPAVRQYIVKVDIDRRRIEIEPGGLFDEM